MRKKAVVLVTACVIIAVAAFFEFYAFKTPTPPQRTTTLDEITSDPSAWVNRTVTVEGALSGPYPPLSNPFEPSVNFLFELSSGNQTVGISLNATLWNGGDFWKQYNYDRVQTFSAIIYGLFKKGEANFTLGNLEGGPPTITPMVFYYIEAQRILLEKE